MINFFSENSFNLENQSYHIHKLKNLIINEGYIVGNINYIFCDDHYLLEINKQYLNHDDYTDIISFNYLNNNTINGDIFISTERVKENAIKYQSEFNNELQRVMFHGLLHFCGYNDKSEKEKIIMRQKEDFYLSF